MTREERVKEAQRLRAEGLSYRQIGERIGVVKSTVRSYLLHPEPRRQGKPPVPQGKRCACGSLALTIYKGKPMCRACVIGPDKPVTLEDVMNNMNKSSQLTIANESSDPDNIGYSPKGKFRRRLDNAMKKHKIKKISPQEWRAGIEG